MFWTKIKAFFYNIVIITALVFTTEWLKDSGHTYYMIVSAVFVFAFAIFTIQDLFSSKGD